MVTVHDRPVQAPVQPTNVDPDAGLAVNLTVLSVGNWALQVRPQSMPLGALVTVPAPTPLFCTVRVDIGGGTNAEKIAATF
jgi:hypothetical protein